MPKMSIRNVTVVVALSLAIVFLGLDKCGSLRKADELKGEHKKAIEIANVERIIKEEIIKERNEKIVVLNTTIGKLNTTIARKDSELAEIEEELGVIKRDFESLEACQSQYDKLSIAFTLCKSINIDKDTLIFSLNEKYEAQLTILISYKDMYESIRDVLVIRDKQVKELEKINKRLRFSSGLKSGLAVVLAGLIVYNLVK